MGLFTGKQGLILGVANEHSIAWHIAEFLMAEGAVCGFSHLPDRPDDERQRNRTRVAKLTDAAPATKFLAPLDVSRDESIVEFMATAGKAFDKIDFLVHSIAHAPLDQIKCDTMCVQRDAFKSAMDVSAYSLLAVTNAASPLLKNGATIVTMTYYGGERPVPGYNLMGICKAALDSCVKYLAYELGPRAIRVNAVSAGPVRTLSGRGAGVDDMLPLYEKMAPLGRNITHEEVARSAGFLLSEMSDGITGEILHVDGGYNIMGSPGRLLVKPQAS